METPSQTTPIVQGPAVVSAIASALIPRRRPRSVTPAAPRPVVTSIRDRKAGCAVPQSQQWPSGATVPRQWTHAAVSIIASG
jgi:hypothetical protein